MSHILMVNDRPKHLVLLFAIREIHMNSPSSAHYDRSSHPAIQIHL